MKRESLNSVESQLNDDALLPLVNNMLQCRIDGFNKVNEKYGTNITVELNSSWKSNADAIDINDEGAKNNDGIQESK